MNEVMDGWTECGATVRKPAKVTERIESLGVGDTAVFESPAGWGHNAPATQASRAGKRLGRIYRWRRSPDDVDSVEVKRIK